MLFATDNAYIFCHTGENVTLRPPKLPRSISNSIHPQSRHAFLLSCSISSMLTHGTQFCIDFVFFFLLCLSLATEIPPIYGYYDDFNNVKTSFVYMQIPQICIDYLVGYVACSCWRCCYFYRFIDPEFEQSIYTSLKAFSFQCGLCLAIFHSQLAVFCSFFSIEWAKVVVLQLTPFSPPTSSLSAYTHARIEDVECIIM